jgi:hypothetical protein
VSVQDSERKLQGVDRTEGGEDSREREERTVERERTGPGEEGPAEGDNRRGKE